MAEEKKTTRKKKAEETPVEEAPTETPTEESAPEPVAEASAEEPVAEEAPPAEEPTPEPAADEPAPDVPVEAAEEAPPTEVEEAETPAAISQPKKKRKRVPRGQRRQRTKPQRERPAARKPITRLPKPESERARRQERRGVVVSSAMDKTIVVKVDTIKAHPRYKKVVRRSVKFHAHDEQNTANVGDIVRIVETGPLSKTKRWRLVQIVEAAK
jgi:small subunit ribosomal protein S17